MNKGSKGEHQKISQSISLFSSDAYVDTDAAQQAGWKTTKKKLSSALPGKMLGGDVFANSASKLLSAPGRVWYEADSITVAESGIVKELYIQTMV